MIRIIKWIIFTIFIFISCARPDIKADHVNEIDSLIHEVNAINKSLSSSRLEHISGIHQQMGQDMEFFNDSMTEVPPPGIKKNIEEHAAIFKKVDSALNSIHSYNEEIFLSTEMLKEYKQQYTKGEVSETELRPLVEKEKYLVRDIRERVDARIIEIENYLENYVLLYPIILEYKEDFKTRNDTGNQ